MLKILIVPFFLLLSLILTVFYMKPTLDDILDKKNQIVIEDQKLAVVDVVASNILRFNQIIDQDKESEDFFMQYLPFTMNQEQIINAFSSLAIQEGLYVSDMEVAVIKKSTSSEEEMSTPKTSPDGTPVVVQTVYEPKQLLFTGSVKGSYENIKAFFSLVNRINRYQKMNFFAIEENKKTPSEATPTEDLVGTFSVVYGFMPHKSVLSPLNTPLFTEGEFSLSEANSLKGLMTTVPAIPNVVSGKPNPFK